jgi:ATP-dependent DNA helicase RecG
VNQGIRLQRFQSFKKVLSLEREQGYSNKSVVGGLDRLLNRWQQTVSPSLVEKELFRLLQNQQLMEIPYSDLSLESRLRWVERALGCFEDVEKITHARAKNRQKERITTTSSKKTNPKLASQKHSSAEKLSLDDPITSLHSINRTASNALARLGVTSIRHLLYLFPRRHNDFTKLAKISSLIPGSEQTILVTVWEIRAVKLGRTLRGAEAIVGDETGNIRVVWFNQPYLARSIKPNSQIVLSGRIGIRGNRPILESPEYEIFEGQEDLIHTGRLIPVYPLTGGLRPRALRRATKEALDGWSHLFQEHLPLEILKRNNFPHIQTALRQAHYPENEDSKQNSLKRLAFDELLIIQTLVLSRRRDWRDKEDAISLRTNPGIITAFLSSLPFQLTQAQEKTLAQVINDIENNRPMSRLIQGDVGSGKTVVALAALLATISCNYQGAIMAPTEILAEQHYFTICRLLGQAQQYPHEENTLSFYFEPMARTITIGLLTGSQTRKKKEVIYKLLSDGSIDIAIGTHALIQESVSIPNLALAVIDEQHRFGVAQRASLRKKGRSPHILVMTATPIPRSLALTLYGDLDVSIIDELPPGRQGITTRWVPIAKRQQAETFVRSQIQKGRQAFIICPLIEESESIQVRAATEEHDRLTRTVFPDLKLGLLHGRLSNRDKNDAMERFRNGETNILVATSVVEVGVDIPNASVMLVEGANRFGLSQLHQLRGRVGRGKEPGYCLLLADNAGEEAERRLSAMERLGDGFAVAEEDLKLRGPGDFLGTRQSGLPELKIASLEDHHLLTLARREATELLSNDPTLKKHPQLSKIISAYQTRLVTDVS